MANCSWVEQLNISTWLSILVSWSGYSFRPTSFFKQDSKKSVLLEGSCASTLSVGLGPVAQACRTAGIIDGFSFQQDVRAHRAVRIRGISFVLNLFETLFACRLRCFLLWAWLGSYTEQNSCCFLLSITSLPQIEGEVVTTWSCQKGGHY